MTISLSTRDDQLDMWLGCNLGQSWPFGNLQPASFSVIVADPPWRFATYSEKGRGKSADRHYRCMTLDGIKALPVARLAASDCALFLWATAPMLPEALAVMAAWGFTYKSNLVWGKTTRFGKISFGTGYRIRNSHEHILIGTIGNPKNSRGERSLLMAQVREHSRKPDEFYEMVERWQPGARRLELFSRQSRPGWQHWGNETGKFDEGGLTLNRESPIG
jgi:N6-adenosine-specific RNA methylase IME4